MNPSQESEVHVRPLHTVVDEQVALESMKDDRPISPEEQQVFDQLRNSLDDERRISTERGRDKMAQIASQLQIENQQVNQGNHWNQSK